MGCSMSKLDDLEAVQLCKDRKKFIKQALDQRLKFAAGHVAYVQAMKRVSAALREYIDGDEPREFSFATPVKKNSSGFISVTPIRSGTNSSYKLNFYRPSGTPVVSVEERPPPSPETYRVEHYSPVRHFDVESMYSSPMGSSSFFHYSPENRQNYVPPSSPRASQWDFFWNPFSSLDYYGYHNRGSLDPEMLDFENEGLRQVRAEEGIPELEEETEFEDVDDRMSKRGEGSEHDEAVVVEDVNDSEDCDCCISEEIETEVGLRDKEGENTKLMKAQSVSKKEMAVGVGVGDGGSKDETPGFTVYVNRRPTSMAEVIKELEDQFVAACKAAGTMSSILEAKRAIYTSSSPHDISGRKMLNPVALFRSASSRSSSSRFLVSLKDEDYESSSDYSSTECLLSGSHQSSLDRLYAWEKKLYQQVRAGERIRLAYEKKCAQLKNQDFKGEDPSFVDKTRVCLRDLQTQIKVSIHAVEAISKRIEALRDEELEPQLLEIVQGLTRMWNVMAECHQRQKRTLDEAKILLAGTPSKLSRTKKYTIMSPSEPHKLAHSAANLETELRNWRACFDSWIISQRSYVHALTGWLLHCVRSESDSSKFPFSPRRSMGAPKIFSICIQWSRLLDAIREAPVLEGMDFFSAGMGSIYAQQLREDSRRLSPGGGSRRCGAETAAGSLDIVDAGQLEDGVVTAEKMSDVAIRVLCAGMSFAVSALTEFAISSAQGYADLIHDWENGKEQNLHENGT